MNEFNVWHVTLRLAAGVLLYSVPFFVACILIALKCIRDLRRRDPKWRFRYFISEIWTWILCISPVLFLSAYGYRSIQNNQQPWHDTIWLPMCPALLLSQAAGILISKLVCERSDPDLRPYTELAIIGALCGPLALILCLVITTMTIEFIF